MPGGLPIDGIQQNYVDLWGIREQEDALFARWRQKYDSFVVDGVPSESDYSCAKVRTVLMLKDVNAPGGSGDFLLRHQLETKPNSWWNKVSPWCAGMSGIMTGQSLTWAELDASGDASQRLERLKPFAFIQLKKTCGGGTVTDRELDIFALADAKEIRQQLGIYRPHVIIAAGVGSQLHAALGECVNKGSTSRGVYFTQYALTEGMLTTVIHYMHPSVRARRNVICFGLLDAYDEIAKQYLR